MPVTAFQVAVDQTPTFDADVNLWVWTYDAQVPNKGTYNVRLTASVDGQDVDWTGYITLAGSFEDFVWFEGESNLNSNAGSWVLYESPDNASEWLSVTWSKNESNGMVNSSFTIEKDGDFKNSSISYKVETDATFDRSVIIVDKKNSNTIETDWSSTTSEGRVKSRLKFGDDLYRCRDTNLMDIDCN